MAVIHITPGTLVVPESAYRRVAGETVINQIVIPRSAARMLGITAGIVVRANYHAGSQTYAFVHGGASYRALAAGVIVAYAVDGSEHFRTCKPCRDGLWCEAGQQMIADALGEEVAP